MTRLAGASVTESARVIAIMLLHGFRTLACGAAVIGLVLSAGAPVHAQNSPLAELAKKEQQRRKGTPPPKKVYTNKDLPEAPAASAAPDAAAATPVTDPVPAAAAPVPEQRPAGDQKDEAWWRTRMASAREELRRNEAFLEALQSRVNSLSSDFVNRDDPFQRAKIGEDRQKALAEMDRVKREIEQGKKLIDDIEEEARKSGVPPGWLR